MSHDVIEINGQNIDVASFISQIDDLGALTSLETLTDALEGTEHLIDTIPQIAWLWGHKNGLEMADMIRELEKMAGAGHACPESGALLCDA